MTPWRAMRAGLLVVVVVGLAMGGLALAQDTGADDREPPVPAAAYERILDLLAPLVDDGTITQDQAAAVADRLADTLPPRSDRRSELAATLAGLLGVTAEALHDHVAAGGSVLELAEDRGVGAEELVDGVLAPMAARLDEAVAAGNLTAAEAEERLAEARERLARRLATRHRPDRAPLRDHLADVLVGQLGVTRAELREAAEAGQSLADLAAARGVAPDELVDRLVAPAAERLADAVAEGDLTEDEAAARLDETRDRFGDRVTSPIHDRPRDG